MKSLQVHCYATLLSAWLAGMNALAGREKQNNRLRVPQTNQIARALFKTVIGFSKARIIVASHQNERCSVSTVDTTGFCLHGILPIIVAFYFIYLFFFVIFFLPGAQCYLLKVYTMGLFVLFCFGREQNINIQGGEESKPSNTMCMIYNCFIACN